MTEVIWEPYTTEIMSSLPAYCLEGQDLYTARVPLIHFCIVELYVPDRVLRQFGSVQEIPVLCDTSTHLHSIDLRGKTSVDWVQYHANYVQMWNNRRDYVLATTPIGHGGHDVSADYMAWYNRITRQFIGRHGCVLDLVYWVSQGNKWCDFCKIYIANNPLSIRTHELGQRHKDNVAQRLTTMRKESAAKEKEKKEASRALEQIEEKAKHSYQKDLAEFRESKDSNGGSGLKEIPIKYIGESKDWEYDAASGYYYNLANGCYYDSKTGLYYSNALGKWVKQEEAFPSSQLGKWVKQEEAFPSSQSSRYEQCQSSNTNNKVSETITAGGKQPGLVVCTPLNPMRNVEGRPSSIAPTKRKREDEKPKSISNKEADAIKAREAARKRVEEREKHLLGLYKPY